MEEIQSVNPETRSVVTSAGSYSGDILVVALGADLDIDRTPGLSQYGFEFYSLPGTERLSTELAKFQSGVALISILGLPYKCPPAPFETALRLHDYLEERGFRKKISIRVLSPAPTPLPISKEGSEVILRLFAERQIEFLPGHQVMSIDGSKKHAIIKDRESIPYDIFMAVPIHRVPKAVADSGLVQDGWIAVNASNLETRFKNVYAIGDVTKIPVGAAALPKAGAFADRAAQAVADEIAYRIKGIGSPGKFDGSGTCYLEFGGGSVAKIEANFLGGPAPNVRFVGPSHEFRPDKEQFSSSRLQRWFSK
jgi:sulfide:quinone oxidoreductase